MRAASSPAKRQLADTQEYARQEAEATLRFYIREDVRVIQLRRFSNASGNECTERVAATDHPARAAPAEGHRLALGMALIRV